jgi:hypothetical protein
MNVHLRGNSSGVALDKGECQGYQLLKYFSNLHNQGISVAIFP